MTLKEFYDKLPSYISPKYEFRKRIAHEVGVSSTTLYKWLNEGMQPSPDKLQKLSEITGIPIDELFEPKK